MNNTSQTTLLNSNFILDDLIYIPIGEYNPVYNRPYIVNTTKSAIDNLKDKLEQTSSSLVTVDMLSGVSSQIISNSSVGYETNINKDWISNKKFIFLLKVKSIDYTGVQIISYIYGYTDHDGIANNGSIDLNMNHYINNIIETTEMIINTPLGIIRKEKLYKLYNVFFNNEYGDLYTQRPTDIFENINVINMANYMHDSNVDITFTSNYLNPLSSKSISSSIDNNISTEYLTKIINTGIQDNKSKDIFINSYDVTYPTSTNANIAEPSINDNKFIKYINRISGFKSINKCFTFNTLMFIDNTIYNRFKLINITKNINNPVVTNTPENGEYWHGQDPVTLKAYSLIENTVALATKYGFSKLYFSVSNMIDITRFPSVFITNFNSFINLDDNDFNCLLEIFKNKFIQEIFISETNNGLIDMYADFYIDLLGTTKIYLSFAGYPGSWYTIPTFANSSFSPVLTVDKNTLDYTSYNLSNIIEEVSNNKPNGNFAY